MECKVKPKNFPHFCWNVMQSWSELKNLTQPEKKSPIEIRRECLWLNKDIKINKSVLKWEEWHRKGINLIHNIINENGDFLTTNEIETIYNIKCNFLSYNALKDAIPIEWRKQVKIMKVPRIAISFKENIFVKIRKKYKNINKVTNKDIYWTYIRNIQKEPIHKVKLEQELHIKEDEWNTIHKIPSTIRDTKICAFQYKLLFSLLPCNLYLNRI